MIKSDAVEADSPAARRKPVPNRLDEKAIRWLAELPGDLRPNETATRFPHIAIRLSALWPTPEPCRNYFDDLLLDRRGDRKGFPVRIVTELATLKSHYESVVFPTQQTIWDQIISQRHA